MQTCPLTKKPLCNKCKGPVYKCAPEKNTECKKTACQRICRFTYEPKFAADDKPICVKKAEERRQELERQEKEAEQKLCKQTQMLAMASIAMSVLSVAINAVRIILR